MTIIHHTCCHADDRFLEGIPRQEAAENIECYVNCIVRVGYKSFSELRVDQEAEDKGVQPQKNNGVDHRPEEPHRRADVAGLEITLQELPQERSLLPLVSESLL